MQDVNKLINPQELEVIRPSFSISKELQAQELQEVGVHGRRIKENLIGANTVKQTFFNSFLKGKEAVTKAISGYIFKLINYKLIFLLFGFNKK